MIKKIKLGVTNCYILKTKDGFLLVDTSIRQLYPLFRIQMWKNFINYYNIKYLLLTHHHYDHTGFASCLLRETKAKLIVHEDEIFQLKKGDTKVEKAKNKVLQKITNRLYKIYPDLGTYPPIVLKDGDIVIKKGEKNSFLKEIGIDGEIVNTPGHTSGSISIVFDNKKAIVGDLIINLPLLKTIYYPFVAENFDQIFESLKTLENMGIKKLLPSHGSEVSLKKVIKFFEKK